MAYVNQTQYYMHGLMLLLPYQYMYSMCVSAGMKSSGASNNDPPEPATPTTPPPDPNLYTVRAYKSTPQTSGDRITVLAVSLFMVGDIQRLLMSISFVA